MYTSDIISIISNKSLLSIHVLPFSNLKKDLGLTDIDILCIVNTIEHRFKIQIPDSKLHDISIVQDIIEITSSLL
jgi:acyl carrier protein